MAERSVGSTIPEESEVGENNGENPCSLEELQARLAEMEATQTELADRLKTHSETAEPQLDRHLAVIEEQFRRSFDDRLRSNGSSGGAAASSSNSTAGRSAGAASGRSVAMFDPSQPEADVLLVNRVFRDASRLIGDEWRQVYDGLTARFPPEVVANERDAIERQPPIIQGYKALLSWKELSGEEFNFRQLIDVVRNCDMNDVADIVVALAERREVNDNTKTKSKGVQRRKSDVSSRTKSDVLDNRRMLLLAKKIGGDWLPLGQALGVSEEELNDIHESSDGTTYQGAFKMLWAWRQTQMSNKDETILEQLRQALQQVNKGQLAEQLTA